MSMGYGANYADVIQESDLVKIGNCGKLLKKLLKLNEDARTDIAQGISVNDVRLQRKIDLVDANLQREFKKETGLELNFCYHNSSDNGSSYDDVDGFFWAVSGMYQLSKAGKKFEKVVERKLFVSFG